MMRGKKFGMVLMTVGLIPASGWVDVLRSSFFFSHFPGGHDWFRTKATTMNGNIYATHTDLLSTQFLLHYA